MARVPAPTTIGVRNPPDFPWPGRAIRCLITLPPGSAAISPPSASRTTRHSARSGMPALSRKRVNALVLNVRTHPHQDCVGHCFQNEYSTECYRWADGIEELCARRRLGGVKLF